MTDKHKLQVMIEALKKRDETSMLEMSGYFGGGATIENRIALADGRAMDALHAVITLANYIMESEKTK